MSLRADILKMLRDATTIRQIAAVLGERPDVIKRTAEKMDAAGDAILIRRGKADVLAPADHPVPVCRTCRREFTRKKKSKSVTCARSCAVALSWRNPGTKAQRKASITAQKRTPEGRAKSVAVNNKRWSDPKQRERLAEQSRKRWADPVQHALLSSKIRVVQRSPEKRAKASEARKRAWDDPEIRARMTAGIQQSKSSPEARAKFSKLLKDRWADPVWRAKYTEANKRRNTERLRKVTSERMTAFHAERREARREQIERCNAIIVQAVAAANGTVSARVVEQSGLTEHLFYRQLRNLVAGGVLAHVARGQYEVRT